MGKLDKIVLELLRDSKQPLSLAEIALKLDKPEKAVYKTLRKLFQKGQISSRDRRYTLTRQ